MAFTSEHLKKIKEAYASGALRVRFGDQDITYKSESEMAKIIAKIERELGLSSKPKFTQFVYKRGTT